MEVTLKIELGPETRAFIEMLAAGPVAKTAPAEEKAPAQEPEAEEKPKATRTRRSTAKEETKAEGKPKSFEDLEDDAKLEAIKTEVTKHTKKGKSADIKALLSSFDAGRASELAPEQFNDFHQAITRYGAGESVDAIIGAEDLA